MRATYLRTHPSRRWVLGIATVVILGTLVFLLMPRKLAVTVHVQRLGDFAFSATCQPLDESGDAVANPIHIRFAPAGGDATNSELFIVAGSWVTDGTSGCLFRGQVPRPSDAGVFSMWIDTYGATQEVAHNSPFSDKIEYSASVGAVRLLTGKLTLVQKLSDLSRSEMVRCSGFYDASCGRIYFSNSTKCFGTQGFSDLGQGGIVEVNSNTGRKLAFGRLEYGQITDSPDGTIACEMPFSVVDVPLMKDGYRIQFGHRGELVYTLEELTSSKWQLNFSIGE